MASSYVTPSSATVQDFVLCPCCQTLQPAMTWFHSPYDHDRLKALCQECICTPVVYILQLLKPRNTLKIGSASHFIFRAATLRSVYGPFHVLALLPSQPPRKLENVLHRQLHVYRLPHGSHREVFQFNTLAAQAIIADLLSQYPACVRAAPLWTPFPPKRIQPASKLVLL